jgi:hypothetical protein
MGVFLEAMSASTNRESGQPEDGSAIASLRLDEAGSWPDTEVEDDCEREQCDEERATANDGSI